MAPTNSQLLTDALQLFLEHLQVSYLVYFLFINIGRLLLISVGPKSEFQNVYRTKLINFTQLMNFVVN